MMNCHACGHRQEDDAAAFCGQCGVALARPSPGTTVEKANAADGALRQLADLVEQRGFMPRQTTLELRALAGAECRGAKPAVVVMGEYRRGKSTLVNRLVGKEVVSTSLQPEDHAVRIGEGPAEPPAGNVKVASCNAPLLEAVDLIDTPAASRAECGEIAVALRHGLSAAAIIFCVDARQVLSATEREFLEEELLPLTSCPILLAVTFLDQVPDVADQLEVRGLLARHVDRVGEGRLQLMMLAPGRAAKDPLHELDAWIRAHAGLTAGEPADRGQRIRRLLALIEASLPDASEPDASEYRRDVAAEQRELALSVLGREHRLALTQAISLFRERCSQMRSDLKAVLRAAPQDSHGREGMTHVVRNLRKIVDQSGKTYMTSLQDSLQADGPPALRATSEMINAAGALEIRSPSSAAPRLPICTKRDWHASGLEAAAVAVAVAMHAWIPVLGAGIALVAVNNWRRTKRLRNQAECSLETEAALHQWLSEVQPVLIEEFSAAAEKMFEEIRQQVVRRFDADESEQGVAPKGSDLRQAIAHCREFLETEGSQRDDHIDKNVC